MRRLAALGALATLAACGGPTFNVGAPFVVAHAAPSHGATAIDVATDVRVGFNAPVDETSAEANVSLRVPGEGEPEEADVEVARSTLFFDEGHVMVLVPVRTLPAGTRVTLTVGPDLESVDGVDLDAAYVVEFTTAD